MQRKWNKTIAESTIQNIFSATKQKGIKNRYVEKKKKKTLPMKNRLRRRERETAVTVFSSMKSEKEREEMRESTL